MFKILIKPGVVFRQFNSQFMDFAKTLNEVSEKTGFVPTITSAEEGEHALNSYHELGLAWDVRTRGLKNPDMAACNLQHLLSKIDRRWQVVYGDADHLSHIHIEFNLRK